MGMQSGQTTDSENSQVKEALEFKQVFADELNEIDYRRHQRFPTEESDPEKRAWSMNLLGLAFSGGGIRSATFNLGIIQALAQLKLLRHIDYLSTVSGGGYIGSWLTAQYYRQQHPVQTATDSFDSIEETLAPDYTDKSGAKPAVIRFLRQHSNYLTPRFGLFTADTWSIVVTYLRNGLLNLMILIGLLASVLMIPRLLAAYAGNPTADDIHHGVMVCLGLTIWSALVLGYNLGWYHTRKNSLQLNTCSRRYYGLLLIGVALHGLCLWYMHAHTLSVLSLIEQNQLLSVLEYLTIPSSFVFLYALLGLVDPIHRPFNHDSQAALVCKLILPIMVITYLSSLVIPTLLSTESDSDKLLYSIIGAGMIHLVIWVIAWAGSLLSFLDSLKQRPENLHQVSDVNRNETLNAFKSSWVWCLIFSLISGLVMGGLLHLFTELIASFSKNHLHIKFGPPLYVLWLFLLSVLHTGLIGNKISRDQREWLSRLGAWLLILSITWIVIAGISFFSPLLLDWVAANQYIQTGLASGWVITTVAGLVAGRTAEAKDALSGVRKLILMIAPYVFVFGMMTIVAHGLNSAITSSLQAFKKKEDISKAYQCYQYSKQHFIHRSQQARLKETALDYTAQIQKNVLSVSAFQVDSRRCQALQLEVKRKLNLNMAEQTGNGSTSDNMSFSAIVESYRTLLIIQERYGSQQTVLFIALILTIVLLSLRIDITEFSLHRLYENRLARCYLGASVHQRMAQPFTGFSKHDDIPLHRLLAEKTGDNRQTKTPQTVGPYHLINTAINLVSGEDLAWQERKAASFLLSPLYCGFVPPQSASKTGVRQGGSISTQGYRSTSEFASTTPSFIQPSQHPLTLGDAMTISGAAASPSMGSQTSGVFALLLAIFNIRLGRWVGNPRHSKTYNKSGPVSSLTLLISEMFGLTKSDTQYVYLSDGGHFENLGIYELVRRRCRFIIAVDAGADPDFNFKDLGNAIRKCRADFGVDITIDVNKIRERMEDKFNTWPCAIGTIDYSDTETGTLLYIKSSLLKNVPEDILSYAVQHPTFPHQTTGDQFFTESQFESYRYLGYHIGMEVLSDAVLNNQISATGVL